MKEDSNTPSHPLRRQISLECPTAHVLLLHDLDFSDFFLEVNSFRNSHTMFPSIWLATSCKLVNDKQEETIPTGDKTASLPFVGRASLMDARGGTLDWSSADMILTQMRTGRDEETVGVARSDETRLEESCQTRRVHCTFRRQFVFLSVPGR